MQFRAGLECREYTKKTHAQGMREEKETAAYLDPCLSRMMLKACNTSGIPMTSATESAGLKKRLLIA